MRIILSAISSIFLVMFFSSISLAIPFLHSPQPTNNTFIGGGSQTFSINVTDDNLNSSTVILYIISLNAYEQGESWDNQTLSCTNSANEWKCTKTMSFAIAGSDTVELFYFEANDTDNIKGNNGTSSNPLRFTLDRNPSVIILTPTNGSYVRGNQTISATVTDASSGVKTVEYSTDNSSWIKLQNITSTSFTATWNTTTLSNNQTVTLYARASDNVNNNASLRINVTVDNEVPGLLVLSSLTGNLSGNAQLQVNATDSYSGVNVGNVRYSVDSVSGALGCTGSNYSATCSAVLDTTRLQDGNHTLTFSVTDNAGNSNTSPVGIQTKNTRPSISISEPANNAFIKGITSIRASLVNTEGVSSVEVSIEQGSNITKANMACNTNFTSCSYSLNTNLHIDGGYTIKAKAVNNLNLDVSSNIAVSIDNAKPLVTIVQPTADAKGDFYITADITDANLNQNKAVFNISSFNGSLMCTPQTPSKFTCSTAFNSKQLADGKYLLYVSAQDKAENSAAESKEITVANQATSSSGQGGAGGSEAAPNKTVEEQKKTGWPFPNITLTFKSEYILIGVVIVSVLVVVITLVLVARHGLSKTIITDE